MNRFWFLAFRNLWVRKTRTLITASGILLGVAAMLAISVMSASTTQSLKDFFAQSSGRADLTISDAGSSGEGFPQRTLRRVQQFDGVVAAVGTTTNRVTLVGQDKLVSIAVVGIDPEVDQRMRTYKLLSGQLPVKREKAQNIVLVAKFASDHQIALGDTITVELPSGDDAKFKVTGLLADEGAGHLNGGSVGFVNLDVAETVFKRGSRLDQIDLVAQPNVENSPAQLNQLKDQLQNALGDKYVVALPAATGESVSQALSGLNLGLSIFSVIALFVGMLLIYNTFAMTVAERTHEIGLFRSLGATKRQVLSLVLAEAVFLGLIGTLLGVGGGLLLSIPLVKLMGDLIGLPLESFAIPPGGLIQAVAIGLITTLVAAFLPAWQASRIPPTEALRARAGGREGFLIRHAWKIGLVLLAVATLDGTGIARIAQGSTFFIFTFLGAILLMPTIILLLERGGRGLIGALYGPIGQLGSRNLARSKVRTSLTVGVLMIGVVMNVAIGAMGTSFKASIDDWINAAIGGDFFVSSLGALQSAQQPLRDDLARELATVPGVAAVTPQRLLQQKVIGTTAAGQFTTRDLSILLLGIDPATYRTVSSFQFTGGEDPDTAFADLASGDSILLSTTLRDRWKVQPGDLVRLRTARGNHDFRIAAIVAMFWQGGQSLIISRRALEKYFGDTRVSVFILKMSPGASSADVQQRLQDGIAKSRHLDIQAGNEFRQSFSSQIQQFFALFDAMVWIAVIVGALGVINTMTMNILERVREIGTLRSIGMSRWQLARMVLAEAGAMGVLGSIFGIAVALPVSRVMVTGMSQGSGFPVSYVFPGVAFLAGVLIAMVVSQLAALYPTWRAGRINIMDAIRSE
jgi:putative ABC transport system permease protein